MRKPGYTNDFTWICVEQLMSVYNSTEVNYTSISGVSEDLNKAVRALYYTLCMKKLEPADVMYLLLLLVAAGM